MRLIDGHELKKTFEAWRERLMQKAEMKLDCINVWATERQIELIDAAIDELERMPEIREEPARRGQWKVTPYKNYPAYSVIRCSECGWFIHKSKLRNSDKFNYCPHCGAKMDGETE